MYDHGKKPNVLLFYDGSAKVGYIEGLLLLMRGEQVAWRENMHKSMALGFKPSVNELS
jgi:hypothetical protein